MKSKPGKRELLDVDVRFLLANERTLLAWVRTALALMAGGLVLTQLDDSSARVLFGVVAILTGAAMATIGYVRFRSADEAIRQGRLPDPGHGPALQVVGVIIFAIIIALVELFNLVA